MPVATAACSDATNESVSGFTIKDGHTDSYGTLLYLAAVMGFDPMALGPNSSVELTTWSGHFDGVRASLLCLATYERNIGPEKAAEVVYQHITAALGDLGPSGNARSAG